MPMLTQIVEMDACGTRQKTPPLGVCFVANVSEPDFGLEGLLGEVAIGYG